MALTNSLAGKTKKPFWFTRRGKDDFMRWVDEVEGIVASVATLTTDSIEFAAAASTITLPSDGDAQDLTVQVTGATNSSLILQSSGTGADALQIKTTAGGIDITSTGAAAGEDIDITTNASVKITSSEAAADAVAITASAGGVDISSAATYDIDITATGGKCLVVASEAAADQFKVDATGTVAGYAINLETTDGGILLNADGASNGDIALDAADDITITAAGDLTLAVTGSVKGNIKGDGTDTFVGYLADVHIEPTTSKQVTVAESGTIFTNTGAAGATTFTLPDAAAGLIYTFHDCSATGGDDLIILPQADDTIDGDTAGDGITNTADEASATITLAALDNTRWVTISKTGTWAAL